MLLADVAGYSRMMERDEAGTHLRLREVRARITDPAIERHQGRIVRSRGDDLLAEFTSASEALACAIDIQRAMAQFNRGLAADSRIEFRIGINLGDILFDGTDIAGDGVNVAARLESLAQPGGIAISAAVREQVRQLVGARLSDVGRHRVKNISRPIRVFRVSLDEERGPWSRWRAVAGRQRRVAAIGLLAAVAAALLWQAPWQWLAAPEPPRQSIALLPVQVPGNDERGATLAQTLTPQMASALTQALGVGGHVVQADHDAASHPDRRRRNLNVRYLARVSLTGSEPVPRLTAALIDAATGAQRWSATFHAPPADAPAEGGPFDADALIGQVAAAVATQLRAAELLRTPAPEPPDAEWLVLKARALMPTTATAEELQAVRAMNERALQLRPDYAPALSALAAALAFQADRTADPAETDRLLQRADELSLRAIAVAPGDSDAWQTRALVAQFRGQLVPAAEAIERALLLNPFSGNAHAQNGMILTAAGRAADAVAAFDRAIRIEPNADTVGVHLFHRCRALLYLGRYDAALESCNRALAYTPDWPDFVLLTALHALRGDRERAAHARAELLRREPDFRIGWLLDKGVASPATQRQREEHLIAGLRRAGLPE